MTRHSWIRNVFAGTKTQTIRKAPRRTGLALETLEERCCPARFTVLNTLDNNSQGSLRWAVNQANTTAGADTIDFDAAAFSTAQTITLAGNQLPLTDATGMTTITGPTAGVTVSGGGLSRVFQIDSAATASFSGLTISDGKADSGGGLYNRGTATLTDCTISASSASARAGGLFNDGTLTLNNCTLFGNSAAALVNDGTASLTNCTISANSGGGLVNDAGTTTLTNTIVAGQTSGADVTGAIAPASSHNLIGGNPLLATLGNYGGPTQTMPLLPGSPGIDAGTSVGASSTDQRGFSRVGSVDIGAFESSGFTIAASQGDGQSTRTTTPFFGPLVVRVTAHNPSEPVAGGQITFIAPSSGAAAILTGSPATIAADGTASVSALANQTAGAYTISVMASGSISPTFNLTNTQALAFDFASLGAGAKAATLSLDVGSGPPTLQLKVDGNIVASQPLSLTNAVVVNGTGDDKLIVDYTVPFAIPVQLNGFGDTLAVVGGVLVGSYIPAAGVAGAGRVQVGDGGTIDFTGVSALAVSSLASFTFTTPGGIDDISIDSPASGFNRISGTSAGTTFVPVAFNGVSAVTIDTVANDSSAANDTVTISSDGLTAAGLRDFTVVTGAGDDMLLDYANSFSLPVNGGKFTFNAAGGSNTLVGPSPSLNPNLVLTGVAEAIPVPIIVLPGLTASFATPDFTSQWFSTIGPPQNELQLEPINNAYADLIKSLQNVGYVEGQTLFRAPWDWRLPVAPQDDTLDGTLSNLSVAELTGGVYHYAVDYFGTQLVAAATAWAKRYGGRSLPAVDVVSHSTGGLITRAYVQSPAYGQEDADGLTLPKVNRALMMAVPQQGAAQIWNLLNDDFSHDLEDRGLSWFIGASYQRVVDGSIITSPNGDITLASITVNGAPDMQKFLNLYLPSLHDLQATFPFLDNGSGTLTVGSPSQRNNLLLDLNDGLGLNYALDNIPAGASPNSFLNSPTNSILGPLDVYYSSTSDTPLSAVQKPAGTGSVVPLGSFLSQPATDPWYQLIEGTDNGDLTVPTVSSIGQFFNDPLLGTKIILHQAQPATPGGEVSHSKLPSSSSVLTSFLGDLGRPNSAAVVSQGLAGADVGQALQRMLGVLPSASFSVGGLTFDASELQVSYNTATDRLELTGPSTITVPGLGTITVDLGAGATDGLVLTNNAFTSLDMTVTGDLTVGGLTIHSDGLRLAYQSQHFVMTGAADFSLEGNTVNVMFGGPGSNGLVIDDGSLTSLDMAVTSSIVVGAITFKTTGLRFTYDAAQSQYTLSGTAGVQLGNATGLQVSFGTVGTQGLVITNGALSSLDTTVTGAFTVGDVKITATNLRFQYTVSASGGTFAMTGTANVDIGSSSLTVTFGHGASPGLTVAGGLLASLDLTVNASFTVSSAIFTATDLEFKDTIDTRGTSTFTMNGSASVAFSNLRLGVTFGHDITPGLQLNGGKLSSLAMTVSSSFTFGGVSFATNGLTMDYTSSSFQLQGGASLTAGDNFSTSVNFVSPGLRFSDGSVQELNVSLTSDVAIGKVKFSANGLTARYRLDKTNYTFQLTGTTSVTIGGVANLIVSFASPGLLITNGKLGKLDASVTSSFNIGKVTVGTKDLRFRYDATGAFQLTGTAFVTSTGNGLKDTNITVTFADKGLNIEDGKLQSIDVAVTSTFNIGKVTFGTDKLRFSYDAGIDMFQLTGTAFMTSKGKGLTDTKFFVTFADQGLLIQGGSLKHLSVAVTSEFTIGKVTFGTDKLGFSYDVPSDTFKFTGTAFLAIGGVAGVGGQKVSVTFADQGLLIQGGALTSLDVAITSSFAVSKVEFGTDSLRFKYIVSSNTFQLTGSAFVRLVGFKGVGGGEIRVNFPDGGVLITDGKLVSLQVGLTSSFLIGPATFGTKDLTFGYFAKTNTFQLTGTAFATFGGITLPGQAGNEISVTFANDGILITNGVLEKLDVTINSNFNVGAATITVQDLALDYVKATNSFTITGTAGVSAFAGLAKLDVHFGYKDSAGNDVPGIKFNTKTGSLDTLNLLVTSSVGIGSLGFKGNLLFTYTSSTDTFQMTGAASLNIPEIGSLQVVLGGNDSNRGAHFATSGLVVQGGVFKKLDMMVIGNFSFHGLSFTISSCAISYTDKDKDGNSLFTMTGLAKVTLPKIGEASVAMGSGIAFDGGKTQGIVIKNGVLQTFNMQVSANFSLAGFTINGNLRIDYSAARNDPIYFVSPPDSVARWVTTPAQFTMTGSARASFLGFNSISVTLGGGGSQGMIIRDGKLTAFDMSMSTVLSAAGIISINGKLTASYSDNPGKFTFTGDVSLSLGVPSLFQPVLGQNITLAGVSVTVVAISGDNAHSYFQFSTTVAGISVGLRVNFNGDIALNPKIDALKAIEAAAKKVIKAIEDGWHWFISQFGPLSGATVYYDPNNNFDFANDISAVTARDGRFQLSIPPGSTTGQLVVVGGIDQSTGLANTAILTAPLGARTITPLTTLVNLIMQQTGDTQEDAIAKVQQSLGISGEHDPLTSDYIKEALGGDADAARMFASEVQLSALSYQVDELLRGAGGGTPASISTALFKNLAAHIAQSGGAPLDLTDPALVRALILDTADDVNVSLDPALAAGAATVVAGVNHYIAALPVTASADYLNRVVQAQVVAGQTIAPLLAQAAAGTISIDTVVTQETGTALADQIGAAKVGSLDLDGPTIEIANVVRQPVGNGDPGTMVFKVYLAATTPLTEPVTVDFTTQDGTATAANGDYTPVSGTLTWLPGDTAPKTITVPVHPTSTLSSDEIFQVVLSSPVNAEIESSIGVGDIAYTDVATTTTLTASTASPIFGQEVTLTATVTDQGAALEDGSGSVTFYDGATVLGTVSLTHGLATLTSTDLHFGTHDLSATFMGQTDSGVHFDPSTSDVVHVTVTAATQSIDFAPLANQVYGADPIELAATTSSGLPVRFHVVSGPAVLVDDILTITGAGVVTVQASQEGNFDDQPAPPVVRSFTVSPAVLTFTVDDQEMTYGGTLPTLSGRFTGGFVNGDSLDSLTTLPTLSTVDVHSHAGAYAIVAAGGVASNYTIHYVTGTLTITPAQLAIVADDQSMIYGGTLTALTAQFTGLVNGDTSSAVTGLALTTVPASSHAGTYDITASGAVDSDYDITFVDGTLHITPTPLTITANNRSMVVGSDVPELTATYSGLVNGDTPSSLTTSPTLSTDVTSDDPIGSYPITVDGADDSDYEISYANGVLNVALEAPTVTLTDPPTGPVSGQSVTITAAVTGTQGMATGSVQFQIDGVDFGTVQLSQGSADITATGLSAGNHVVTALFASGDNQYTDSSAAMPLTVLNTPPVALDEHVDLTLLNAGVDLLPLANDTDADGNALQIVSIGPSDVGQMIDRGDGRFTFVPNSHNFTHASIPYVISDGQGGQATATISIDRHLGGGAGNNEAYVNALYRQLLGRDAEAGAVAYWVESLTTGESRQQVGASILNSHEGRLAQINDLYHTYLGRNGDSAGLLAHEQYLNAGGTLERLKANFLASPEFVARSGGAPLQYVDALYHAILGRSSNGDDGANLFANRIKQGDDIASVVNAILNSHEGNQNLAKQLYATIMEREADTAGLSYWTNALQQSGHPEEMAIASFLGSDEFFNRS
jgi:hypothetical protein